MNISPVILFIKKIRTHLVRAEILDWLYLSITLVWIAVIVIISISTLVFLLHTFDAVIFVSDKEAPAHESLFDIAQFSILAPRFGITIHNTPTPPGPVSSQKETPIPTPAVSVTTSALFSELKLRILNGTPTTGLAATWKKRFEEQGLSIITIGNASERTLKGIHILYKSGKERFLENVRGILKQYGGGITHEQTDDSLTDDMVIMIGQ